MGVRKGVIGSAAHPTGLSPRWSAEEWARVVIRHGPTGEPCVLFTGSTTGQTTENQIP
jgi:hypothetical protein